MARRRSKPAAGKPPGRPPKVPQPVRAEQERDHENRARMIREELRDARAKTITGMKFPH
jgi:hypothetical protein